MRNINPFGLRLQPELKSALEEAAQMNKRSLNAEITARLQESFTNEPVRQVLSEYEAAVHTLTSLYEETQQRIAEWKRRTNISDMDKIELMHEEATARYLRHAIARAALPREERERVRKQPSPLGIDTEVYRAARIAENTKPTK